MMHRFASKSDQESKKTKMNKSVFILLATFHVLAACDKDDENYSGREFTYNFANSTEGWDAFFSDYPQGSEELYELTFGHARLPAPLDVNTPAAKISGNNHSD